MANDVVSNLGKWMWYLIPANPILVRVVHGGGRRMRHHWYRFAYLLVLFLVFVLTYASQTSGLSGSLSEVAKTSTQIFRFIAWAQLILMCFLAPVFTAGAITQERDAETFNILLTTPLSNAQIVFGSLLSRLFFVILLLFSGLPIFCITMIYGGVTFAQIILSFAIAGATALVTGSVAIMISMIRVGTRRTIFSFAMAIGLYLLVLGALGYFSFTQVPEATPIVEGSRKMSWLAPFHPFLSLQVGLGSLPAPSLADVAHYGWPAKYLLAYPHVSYVVVMCVASLLMICVSMFFVRSCIKEGEATWFNRIFGRFSRSLDDEGQRKRKPRRVWSNPIAWREASSKASTFTSILARYGMMVVGIMVSIVILLYLANGWIVRQSDGTFAPFGPPDARQWLMWVVLVEFTLILLIATNAAATSMTKERESNTMDILLATPLTSKMIVWGKLRGLIAFTVPMLAVPVLSLLIFVVYDAIIRLAGSAKAASVINFEAVPLLAMLMLVYTALACVIGLQTSLKSKKTVKAILVSIAIVTMGCGLSFVIADAMVDGFPGGGPGIAPFTPFTAVIGMINGTGTRDFGGYSFSGTPAMRIVALIGSCVALTIGALIVSFMYKALVKNFDMTVRKQTAS